jgi:peptidoglycan/xylan/chitin deacetylase (PgdA/CDA1 family)
MKTPISMASVVLFAAGGFAGPVTTVPWNGRTGAASFTFDDGLQSQITNVMPALRARKINATFFVIGVNWSYWNDPSAWLTAAKAGDEIANHTVDHASLPTLTTAQITAEIANWADTLRSVDTSIQAVSMAYPGCATSTAVDNVANTENIIARVCSSNTPYTWTSKPSNWMEMQCIYVSDDATATGAALTSIDAAKNNAWITTLDHGVSGDYLTVTTANVEAMFDRAIKDSLWIAPYSTVAAYWRASFTMDGVTPSGSGPWSVSWTSPHPKMPRRVMLKVKLATATFGDSPVVSQGSTTIAPNTDGSYTIDFMKLGMAIAKKGSTELSPLLSMAPGSLRARLSGSSLALSGLPSGSYSVEIRTLSGAVSAHAVVRAVQGSETRMALPDALPHQVHVVVVEDLHATGGKTVSPLLP